VDHSQESIRGSRTLSPREPGKPHKFQRPVIDSLTTLLTGIVDYAGLFPPAALDMNAAVRAYANYWHDPSHFMLGRFVVPVARLPEFDEASQSMLPRGDSSTTTPPWLLSALVGPDVDADIQQALKFNCRHWSGSELGHAVIDSLELKASSSAEISAAMSRMPKQFRPFFEIPTDPDPAPLIVELKRAGGCAKIRTGGVTQNDFPPSAHVARFLKRCQEQAVPFKATAGLHHPLRSQYALTYEPHAPVATMYGYLNLFIAAASAHTGADEFFLDRILEETSANTFVFHDTGLTYGGETLTSTVLDDTRHTFALSFGSCSFREPVDDLVALTLA